MEAARNEAGVIKSVSIILGVDSGAASPSSSVAGDKTRHDWGPLDSPVGGEVKRVPALARPLSPGAAAVVAAAGIDSPKVSRVELLSLAAVCDAVSLVDVDFDITYPRPAGPRDECVDDDEEVDVELVPGADTEDPVLVARRLDAEEASVNKGAYAAARERQQLLLAGLLQPSPSLGPGTPRGGSAVVSNRAFGAFAPPPPALSLHDLANTGHSFRAPLAPEVIAAACEATARAMLRTSCAVCGPSPDELASREQRAELKLHRDLDLQQPQLSREGTVVRKRASVWSRVKRSLRRMSLGKSNHEGRVSLKNCGACRARVGRVVPRGRGVWLRLERRRGRTAARGAQVQPPARIVPLGPLVPRGHRRSRLLASPRDPADGEVRARAQERQRAALVLQPVYAWTQRDPLASTRRRWRH
jgi:hypothetical protein